MVLEAGIPEAPILVLMMTSVGTDRWYHQLVSRTLQTTKAAENASILEPIRNPSRT